MSGETAFDRFKVTVEMEESSSVPSFTRCLNENLRIQVNSCIKVVNRKEMRQGGLSNAMTSAKGREHASEEL